MMTTRSADTRRDELVERLFGSALGAMDLLCVYLGDRLGMYRALAEAGPSTSAELASAAGVNERYAREWLEQQAMTGILEAVDPDTPDAERRYDLVTIFEALHDMAYPVAVLRTARALLSDGGRVLVADEKTAERFTLDAGDVERLYYGFSVLHCLPVGMVGNNAAERAPSCARTPCAPTPSRPASPVTRSRPSKTTSRASTC